MQMIPVNCFPKKDIKHSYKNVDSWT